MLLFRRADSAMSALNRFIIVLGAISLLAAALILSWSVLARALFHIPTEWQDEASLFCLVGTTFICAAYVQEKRGHIGISALEGLMPHAVNRVRVIVIDVVAFLFFAFFAKKTWDLFSEAWVGQEVSDSTWGPPLWIPYGLMATGITLLAIQIFLQIVVRKPIATHGSH